MSHKSLWNDLPLSERERLMPYMMEAHKLHILQCKEKAIKAHKRHMVDLDGHIKSIEQDLHKFREGEK